MPVPKGKRYGGKPKGYKHAKTIEKETVKDIIRRRLTEEIQPLLNAQIAHAKGVQYMVLRQADGSYARATDEKQIDIACAIGGSAFSIFTAAPNVQAFAYLMDRGFDRPVQPKEVTGEEGGPIRLVVEVPWQQLRGKKNA